MSSGIISNADASRIAIPAEDEGVAALRDLVVAKLTYAHTHRLELKRSWSPFYHKRAAGALSKRDSSIAGKRRYGHGAKRVGNGEMAIDLAVSSQGGLILALERRPRSV